MYGGSENSKITNSAMYSIRNIDLLVDDRLLIETRKHNYKLYSGFILVLFFLGFIIWKYSQSLNAIGVTNGRIGFVKDDYINYSFRVGNETILFLGGDYVTESKRVYHVNDTIIVYYDKQHPNINSLSRFADSGLTAILVVLSFICLFIFVMIVISCNRHRNL